MEALVAVAEGDFTFGWESVASGALAHWHGSEFTRHEESSFHISFGQLRLPGVERRPLLVEFLAGDNGIGIDGPDGVAADFFSWLASRPGFPTDGSVVIVNWTLDFFDLRPGLDAAEILAARASQGLC